MYYFPKEVWYQIKSYEFQLKFPKQIQNQYRSYLYSMVRLPYFLKEEHKKNINYQNNFLRINYSFLWDAFNDNYIKQLIEKELDRMNNDFDSIYLKQICHGRF